MGAIPEYLELETDDLDIVVEEEQTSNTWILNESSKTIGPISEDREECIVQSVKCALRTERQGYEMYPIDYGSDLHEKLGDTKPHVYAEIEFSIRECLKKDERINSVSNFKFEDHGGNITAKFDMDVSTETVQIEEEVNIDG